MLKKVILAGGSGFLGQALGRRLRERGHEVVVLTRSNPRRRGDGIREVRWNPEASGPSNPIGDKSEESWEQELEEAMAVVNLAGRSVDCVHTEENRRAILQTRLDAVQSLGRAFAACARPPAAWVQASATGYYGNVEKGRCAEETPVGSDHLAQVCRQCEEAFARACPAAVRPVVLRIGVVLGRKGGAF
ncbi:MAG: NAD-dependent epimerase/dehydratase family protein, partial [Opitutales bacterium]